MFIMLLTWDKESTIIQQPSWQKSVSESLARERKKDEESYLKGIVMVHILSVVVIGNSYAVKSGVEASSE